MSVNFGNATGCYALRLGSSISVSVWTPLKRNHIRIHLTPLEAGVLS